MKIVYYSWGANSDEAFIKALREQNYDVKVFSRKCKHYTRDLEFAKELIFFINYEKASAVVSYDYFPIISMVCNTTGIEYYSWVYDSPHFTLYAKTTNLTCNHIFVFDRELVEKLKMIGVSTVDYLPLAVDGNLFKSYSGTRNLKADVSFVGSLYNDKYNYYDCLFKGEIDEKIISDKILTFGEAGKIRVEDIDEETMCYVVKRMEENNLLLNEDYYDLSKEVVLASVFEKKITSIERDLLIRRIIKNDYIDFGLYTNSVTDIPNRGVVDYYSEMPEVFRQSKINLNISLRSIHAGIPLRVLDIMANGGFVLSDYKEEIAKLLKEDEEIVLFRNEKECMDKIDYYLKNEDKRKRIAENGKRAVENRFAYQKALRKIFEKF